MKIRWESGADSLLLLWSKSKYTKSSRCFRFRPICSHKWWAKKWLLMSHDTLGQMARELLLSKKLFPAWFPPQENTFPWFWFSVRSGSHNITQLIHMCITENTLFNTCWNSIYWSEVGVFFSSFRSVVIWFPWTTQACRDSWAQNCALLRDSAKSRYWIISLLPPFNTMSLSHKKSRLVS